MENNTEFINMRQTSKYQNGKVLFELNDNLKRAGFDDKANRKIRDLFGKIHARYSGFRVVARDYSQGTGDKLVDLELRLGPEEIKTISEDVLEKIKDRRKFDLELQASTNAGTHYRNVIQEKKKELETLLQQQKEKPTMELQKQIELTKDVLAFAKMSFSVAQYDIQVAKQKIELMSEKVFYEQKIAPSTIEQNSQYSRVTALTVEYNTKMQNPWTLIVENGLGIREKTSTGGFKIKSGSYKDGKKIRIFLSNADIRKLFRKAADYTRAWECTNQGIAAKQRYEYEMEDRKNYSSNK